MRKAALVLFAITVVVASAFAGGQSEQKASAPAKPVTSLSWSEIVAQAKKEGKVVWYQWYFQPEFRTFTKAFTEKYGIQVVIPDGTLQANTDKFLAARNRPVGDIDVLSFGGDYTNNLNVESTLLGPITSVIPDGGKLKTAIQGGDSHGYAVVFWGNQVGIAYNPAHVSESELPQTVAALGSWMQAHPNRFGFNVSNGGSGPAFIQSIARNLVPGDYTANGDVQAKVDKLGPVWQWFKNRKSDFVITASNADSITRMNDGEFYMVSAFEDQLSNMEKHKTISSNFKFYIPKFGMPGGGNMVGVPKNAPHAAAALLFIDWLTSADVQARMNEVFGSAPENPDAHSTAALIPMSERARSSQWYAKKLGDAVLQAFQRNVLMN